MRHSALNEPLTVMIPVPDAGTGAAVVQPDTAVAADGTLDDRSVMLISAGFEVIPGMIAVTADGKKREITAVRVCRTLNGRRTIYRCTFE
ncbi:MAG: hypothetical protein PHI85_09380 [Victivallaceae bacterium]|nr:hypothetical protein [Victivallaceae bacterium]